MNKLISPSTATIGTQVWMLKNLDVSYYKNGELIQYIYDPAAWAASTSGAWCWYNNDATNGVTFGKLYNWYAVTDKRGLAPAGYHIPSDAEWTILSTTLGGESVAGCSMKETGTTHWKAPNNGATNSSLFTGLPGGLREGKGKFYNAAYIGGWWSSSETNSPLANCRFLMNDADGHFTVLNPKGAGFSVRCLKD